MVASRHMLLGFVVVAVLLSGCAGQKTTDDNLNFEESFMALGPIDEIQESDDLTYEPGERASLVLKDVNGFLEEDGRIAYRIETVVIDPNEEIYEEKNVTGEAVANEQPLDLQGSIIIEEGMNPGQYEMRVTLYDQKGDGKLTTSLQFIVEEARRAEEPVDMPSNETWQSHRTDLFLIDYPMTWNVSREYIPAGAFRYDFDSNEGTKFSIRPDRFDVKRGLESRTEEIVSSIESEGLTATINNGQIFPNSKWVDVRVGDTRKRLVLVLEEYESFERLYNISFHARNDEFDKKWETIFEPALQSFETLRMIREE